MTRAGRRALARARARRAVKKTISKGGSTRQALKAGIEAGQSKITRGGGSSAGKVSASKSTTTPVSEVKDTETLQALERAKIKKAEATRKAIAQKLLREQVQKEREQRIKELSERQQTRSAQQTQTEQQTFSREQLQGTVTAAERPTSLTERAFGQASRLRETSRRAREKGRVSLTSVGTGLAAGALFSGASTVQFGKQLVTRPLETTVNLGKGVVGVGRKIVTGEGFPELGAVLKAEPAFAAGFVGGEIVQAKGIGAGLKGASKVGELSRAVLSPRFSPVKKGVVTVKSSVPGRTSLDIAIGGPVSELAEPLASQARVAGTRVDAVSAQRGLFSPLKRKITVEKPKPTPDAPELERALFVDPKARLRPSRLGLADEQPKATIVDILSGDVTFKATKPQAILFENVKVAKFPTSLKSVERKLLTGKPLTGKEAKALEEFQLKPSGEFKPVGFLSKEPELVASPGEVIKRVGTAGVTIIKGRRVPIFRTEIVQASPEISSLIAKPSLTGVEKTRLTSLLKKQTGLSVSLDARLTPVVTPFSFGFLPGLTFKLRRTLFKPEVSPVVRRPAQISPSVRLPSRPSSVGPSIKLPSRIVKSSPSKSPSIAAVSRAVGGGGVSPIGRVPVGRPATPVSGPPSPVSVGRPRLPVSRPPVLVPSPRPGVPFLLKEFKQPPVKKFSLPEFDRRKRRGKRRGVRRLRFTPDVTAQVAGIRTRKKPKFDELTGLSSRPVFIGGRF